MKIEEFLEIGDADGTACASTGLLRFKRTTNDDVACCVRKADDSEDVTVWYVSSSSNLHLGNNASYTKQSPTTIVNAANDVHVKLNGTTKLLINSTGWAFDGVTPVARPAYTVTSPTTDRAFNASNATLAELRNVVGTIIEDLKAKGVFQ